MDQKSSSKLYRFAVFEVDERSGELHKQGRRLGLQGQPFQVLVLLLDRAGELVTRTELQQRIWPDGTFVDFEHGLNSAINKIRDALGDSAVNPRFIETLAKRGYRFIATVEVQNGSQIARSEQGPAFGAESAAASAHAPETRFLTAAADIPHAPRTVTRVLFLLLQLMYLSFYVTALARLREIEQIVSRVLPTYFWLTALLIVTAAAGIPIRLYLLSGIAFRPPALRRNFLRLFPFVFPFDELWALAPFLLIDRIGFGLALGATAALLYAPFAQRSLILMACADRPGSPHI